MGDWSVRIRAVGPSGSLTDERVFETLEHLEGFAPAASVARDGSSIALRFSVAGDTAGTLDAARRGVELVQSALRPAELGLEIAEVEATTMDELEHEIETRNVPEMVGVAELADLLHVSKQRASSLAKAKSFPRPFAILASGPVWAKTTVLRFLRDWPRRPGRPPASVLTTLKFSKAGASAKTARKVTVRKTTVKRKAAAKKKSVRRSVH
jgi:hypothetical protein